MRAKLQARDFYTFPKLDYKDLDLLDQLIKKQIPHIVQYVAGVEDEAVDSDRNSVPFDREVELSQEIQLERLKSARLKQDTLYMAIGFVVVIIVLVTIVCIFVFNKQDIISSGFGALSKGAPSSTGAASSESSSNIQAVIKSVKEMVKNDVSDLSAARSAAPIVEGGEL